MTCRQRIADVPSCARVTHVSLTTITHRQEEYDTMRNSEKRTAMPHYAQTDYSYVSHSSWSNSSLQITPQDPVIFRYTALHDVLLTPEAV